MDKPGFSGKKKMVLRLWFQLELVVKSQNVIQLKNREPFNGKIVPYFFERPKATP